MSQQIKINRSIAGEGSVGASILPVFCSGHWTQRLGLQAAGKDWAAGDPGTVSRLTRLSSAAAWMSQSQR